MKYLIPALVVALVGGFVLYKQGSLKGGSSRQYLLDQLKAFEKRKANIKLGGIQPGEIEERNFVDKRIAEINKKLLESA